MKFICVVGAAVALLLVTSPMVSCGRKPAPPQVKGAVGGEVRNLRDVVQRAFSGLTLDDVERRKPETERLALSLMNRANVTGQQLVTALASEDSVLSPAVAALVCMRRDVTQEMLISEFTREFSGMPYMAAVAIVHKCSSLQAACRLGLRLLDGGPRKAMLGHAVLALATMQPVDPDHKVWLPGVVEAVNPESWKFLQSIEPLSYRLLIERSLLEYVGKPLSEWPVELGIALGVVLYRGNHPGHASVYNLKSTSEVRPWVNAMRSDLCLRDVAEISYPWTRLVEAHIIGLERAKR